MSANQPDAINDDLIPEVSTKTVQRTLYTGVATCVLSALIGFICSATGQDQPGILSTLCLGLILLGTISLGATLSMAPTSPRVWLLSGVSGLLAAQLGVPAHWDSLTTLLNVLGCVCLVGAALYKVSKKLSQLCILGMIVFHFSSIFCATTWPEPAPWLTVQIGQRVYLPFMQFTYLRNAYHFYSPEPGPSNLLFILIETEETNPDTNTKETKSSWITLPHRHVDMRDPLGVTYYRRLSITESASRISGDLGIATDEKSLVNKRREDVALGSLRDYPIIPYAPDSFEPRFRQHLQPTADVTRYILPSFARHIAQKYSLGNAKVTKIKLYRAEHKIVTTQFFVQQDMSPYYPTLYRVYFLGDYTPEGQLINTQDPMLYWVVPILPKSGKRPLNKFTPSDVDDYLSKHSGFEFDWNALHP